MIMWISCIISDMEIVIIFLITPHNLQSNLASLICVLCFIKLENKSDVNLVNGKRAIDIPAKIEDLDFVVQPLQNTFTGPV